jgi:hypothetical protein
MAAIKKKVAKPKTGPTKPVVAKAPSPAELNVELGPAAPVWAAIVDAAQAVVPCELEWRPAKTLAFGRYGVLRRKDRTLLYLLPQPGALEVRVMLGERAFGLAMEAKLPARIKKLARDAKVYPEGHYIPIIAGSADIPGIITLLECKLAPKE